MSGNIIPFSIVFYLLIPISSSTLSTIVILIMVEVAVGDFMDGRIAQIVAEVLRPTIIEVCLSKKHALFVVTPATQSRHATTFMVIPCGIGNIQKSRNRIIRIISPLSIASLQKRYLHSGTDTERKNITLGPNLSFT